MKARNMSDTPKTDKLIISKDQYDSFDGWLDARELERENAWFLANQVNLRR